VRTGLNKNTTKLRETKSCVCCVTLHKLSTGHWVSSQERAWGGGEFARPEENKNVLESFCFCFCCSFCWCSMCVQSRHERERRSGHHRTAALSERTLSLSLSNYLSLALSLSLFLFSRETHTHTYALFSLTHTVARAQTPSKKLGSFVVVVGKRNWVKIERATLLNFWLT